MRSRALSTIGASSRIAREETRSRDLSRFTPLRLTLQTRGMKSGALIAHFLSRYRRFLLRFTTSKEHLPHRRAATGRGGGGISHHSHAPLLSIPRVTGRCLQKSPPDDRGGSWNNITNVSHAGWLHCVTAPSGSPLFFFFSLGPRRGSAAAGSRIRRNLPSLATCTAGPKTAPDVCRATRNVYRRSH